MYRKERRIPTLLALFLLFSGLGAAIYIDRTSQSGQTAAGTGSTPSDIHVTNISDRSFTVSWVTDTPAAGSITLIKEGKQLVLLDDLDTDAVARARLAHVVTATDLLPNTEYPLTIRSGRCAKNQCPELTQKTAAVISTPSSLPPLRGTVQTADGNPADGALVYVTVGNSLPLSSRTDSAGLWVIPMTNIRRQDLSEQLELSDADIVQIAVKRASTETISATLDVKSVRSNVSLPPLIFGNSYNLTDLLSKRKQIVAQQERNKTLGTSTNRTGSAQSAATQANPLDILFPKRDNDTTTDRRPRFRGIGIPDTNMIISLDGGAQATSLANDVAQAGTVKIGRDGTWNTRPTKELTPGTHRVTIQGVDRTNKPVSLSRQFIVLKSGERVLGESTPSSSLTPTLAPTSGATTPSPTEGVTPTIVATASATPTLTPTLTPTATITPVVLPSSTPTPTVPVVGEPERAGVATYTFLFAGAGIGLLAIAAALFVLP